MYMNQIFTDLEDKNVSLFFRKTTLRFVSQSSVFGQKLKFSAIVHHAQGAFNAPEPSKDFSLIHTTEERYIERGLLLFCCDRITRGPDSDSKLAVGFIGENTVYISEQ